ncbi:MAG: polyphosphate kinase 1 [Clostridia bacterium]
MEINCNSTLFTQNRELSWLKFNERVLDEAQDRNVPILERLKFVSIFISNLDEFFMIRVGSLFDLAGISDTVDVRSGMTTTEQIDAIYKSVRPLYKKKDQTYREIDQELRINGVYDLSYKELEASEQKIVKQYFRTSILPILSPQIIDSHHPFPHISNTKLHIATILKLKNKEVFGLIPIPPQVPSLFYLPGNEVRYIRTENVIAQFVSEVFENYTVEEKAVIRLTRNADMNFDDENFEVESDFRKNMKKLLTKRRVLSPVRLEISSNMSEKLQNYLKDKLSLENKQVFYTSAPMVLGLAFSLSSKLSEQKKKNLAYPEFTPQIPSEIDMNESITKQIMQKDVLLSYPFESIAPFLRLIKEASVDPEVVSIKITIYRLASKTKLVEYLCAAAENGKDVTVLIELRARFDEQNNIDWSERLEESGCNIIYGFESYKVHSKICLITKREKNEIRYITQVGTGNYNEKTAELYTDVSLMTYDQNIGKDAAEFFKNMGIGNLLGNYKHLLVAPVSLKSTVMDMIDEQKALGENGKIFIKMNSLTDTNIIDKLHEASCAGVRVIMIIRGICCILPKIPGQTENIEITSVVGRYLEHSRIYAFGTGENAKIYIASADFMTRNTQKRVEVACPIYDKEVRKKLTKIMETSYFDNVKARVLQPSGEFTKKKGYTNAIDSQQVLMEDAIKRADATERKPKKRSFINRLKNAINAFKD